MATIFPPACLAFGRPAGIFGIYGVYLTGTTVLCRKTNALLLIVRRDFRNETEIS
jgi:hypothetical protein